MTDCLTPWNFLLYLFGFNNQCADIFLITGLTSHYTTAEYVPYFIKTFLLELPIYFLLLKTQQSKIQILKTVFILNIATHPLIFLAFPLALDLFNGNYLTYLLCAEIFAPTVEILLLKFYFKIDFKKAFAFSLFANLFSWSIGVYWT